MKDFIDKKTKKLYMFFIIFLLIMILASFYKYFIVKDYYIKIRVDCDPRTESCFVARCDEEDSECEENANKRLFYYKMLKKKAFDIPSCYNTGECLSINCNDIEDCIEILCSEDKLTEGESCNSPTQ
ncbi:MAG: hypothetical protein PHW52_04215 [Candidatus Pacebacteria bacterium]|nr:hypothetical protein [Candidatus Paceibacterota bacterium]